MHLPHAMIFLICLAPLLALIFLLHLAHPFAMSFLLLRLTLQGKIKKLKEDLVDIKKSKVKPSQDNGFPMKKLEKRSTATYSICHEGGHKSYKCKLRKKKKEDKEKTTTTITSTIKAEEKKKMTRKKTSISNTHTKKTNEGK